MKKSEINKILKDLGLSFVKVNTGDWAKPEKCYTNFEGKRVKGIKATNRGPLDITDAADKRIDELTCKIIDTFRKEYFKVENGIFTSPDGKLSFNFIEETYPQYTRSANLDDGYIQVVLIPNFL